MLRAQRGLIKDIHRIQLAQLAPLQLSSVGVVSEMSSECCTDHDGFGSSMPCSRGPDTDEKKEIYSIFCARVMFYCIKIWFHRVLQQQDTFVRERP